MLHSFQPDQGGTTSGQYTLECTPLDESPPSDAESSRGTTQGIRGEPEEDLGDACSSSNYLEVVRQGQYVGFRSASAGGRFLQPRRKPPHRLVFFNAKLGVWEQWEVLGEEAGGGEPWRRMPLVFRSRRMPHVELRVEVLRVGFYPTSGPTVPIRGSALTVVPEATVGWDSELCEPAQVELSEDEHLRRINSMFVHEWIRCGAGPPTNLVISSDLAHWPC